MADFAQMILVGGLTADTEVRTTQSGQYVEARLGVSRSIPDGNGGWKRVSDYYRLVAAEGRPGFEALKNRPKGELLHIVGRPYQSTNVVEDGGTKTVYNNLSVSVVQVTYLQPKEAVDTLRKQSSATTETAHDVEAELMGADA